jgi:hypothetical protein
MRRSKRLLRNKFATATTSIVLAIGEEGEEKKLSPGALGK